MDTDNSVVICGGRGVGGMEEGVRRINGNGKNTIKISCQKLLANIFSIGVYIRCFGKSKEIASMVFVTKFGRL